MPLTATGESLARLKRCVSSRETLVEGRYFRGLGFAKLADGIWRINVGELHAAICGWLGWKLFLRRRMGSKQQQLAELLLPHERLGALPMNRWALQIS